MDNFEQNIEEKKKELQEKTGDTGFFTSIFGAEAIPVESLAAMGDNVTLAEFLDEMKKHGLSVSVSPKKKAEPRQLTEEELAAIPLAPAVDDTAEGRKRYGQIRDEARAKLDGEIGFIQSVLEDETPDEHIPVDEAALEALTAAGYQGDFKELRKLAKNLKKKD